jgi:hypothetical protein
MALTLCSVCVCARARVQTSTDGKKVDGAAGLALVVHAAEDDGGIGRDSDRGSMQERRRGGLGGVHVPRAREQIKPPAGERMLEWDLRKGQHPA